MKKDDKILIKGKVTDILPSQKFKVLLENGCEITAYLSGRLVVKHVRVLQGDEVEVELSPYDLTNGRITYRYL